jgi:hypothetical protein
LGNGKRNCHDMRPPRARRSGQTLISCDSERERVCPCSMGQAKQRRRAIATQPCICGRGMLAGECCLDGRWWHRKPTALGLVRTNGTALGNCYLADLNGCSDKISREHLISEAVLRVIRKDELVASGLPWMKEGEIKIGLNTVVGKCLCTSHNSMLSPLDAEAAKFFRAMEECDLHRSGEAKLFLFSGHDIERWLLKTLAGFGSTRNFANKGERLPGSFHPLISISCMLQDVSSWPATAGLYYTQKLGEPLLRGDHFWMAPLSTPSEELAGMLVSIQGFEFTFLAVPTQANPELARKSGVYRPQRMVFKMPEVTNVIELPWEDGKQHREILATFQMTHGQQQAEGLAPPKNSV